MKLFGHLLRLSVLFVFAGSLSGAGQSRTVILKKLQTIHIPQVELVEVPLPDVLLYLQTASAQHDPAPADDPNGKGVQFVLLTRENSPPQITLTLRTVRLATLLTVIMELTGYRFEVRDDLIVVKKLPPKQSKKISRELLESEFYQLSETMIRRMSGTPVRQAQ